MTVALTPPSPPVPVKPRARAAPRRALALLAGALTAMAGLLVLLYMPAFCGDFFTLGQAPGAGGTPALRILVVGDPQIPGESQAARADHPGLALLDQRLNDQYMVFVTRAGLAAAAPTHQLVVGDLHSSEHISTRDFAARAQRIMQIFGPGDPAVLAPAWSTAAVLETDGGLRSGRTLYMVGNHDVGYAGTLSDPMLKAFERHYGAVNRLIELRAGPESGPRVPSSPGRPGRHPLAFFGALLRTAWPGPVPSSSGPRATAGAPSPPAGSQFPVRLLLVSVNALVLDGAGPCHQYDELLAEMPPPAPPAGPWGSGCTVCGGLDPTRVAADTADCLAPRSVRCTRLPIEQAPPLVPIDLAQGFHPRPPTAGRARACNRTLVPGHHKYQAWLTVLRAAALVRYGTPDTRRLFADPAVAPLLEPFPEALFALPAPSDWPDDGPKGGHRPWRAILLTHIPLHKAAGHCTDAPHMRTFSHTGDVAVQNFLSEDTSSRLLGLLRPLAIVAGHDHEGCRFVHHLPEGGWDAPNGGAPTAGHRSGSDPAVAPEFTARSIMSDYSGSIGLLSLRLVPEDKAPADRPAAKASEGPALPSPPHPLGQKVAAVRRLLPGALSPAAILQQPLGHAGLALEVGFTECSFWHFIILRVFLVVWLIVLAVQTLVWLVC
ncbi:hypothetical protein H696_01684 [Fonticula alba]|uniref:Calcineurin-like phosphoesterase domain-containing protein n=1 Tax=Fonticula alba TaxID=691883 RepID=A0A058ZEB4_FONAL|nr:hypothetical protein H696_01684 [Fonticula alba]KCV72286.1 hypothetical protein H696_01684 [Fonticula alba]|eukprot:XP_009493864.1 hypothetical protein H696_01684 [Fonticula alba]